MYSDNENESEVDDLCWKLTIQSIVTLFITEVEYITIVEAG